MARPRTDARALLRPLLSCKAWPDLFAHYLGRGRDKVGKRPATIRKVAASPPEQFTRPFGLGRPLPTESEHCCMPRPRSRSRSPHRTGAFGPHDRAATLDARDRLTTAALPVEIQVEIDRSGYYLGTAMLLFVVLLWILVSVLASFWTMTPSADHFRVASFVGELPHERSVSSAGWALRTARSASSRESRADSAVNLVQSCSPTTATTSPGLQPGSAPRHSRST